jgi:hypothetical protein
MLIGCGATIKPSIVGISAGRIATASRARAELAANRHETVAQKDAARIGQTWKERGMNWDRVERALDRGFRARPLAYGETTAVERRKPFPLWQAMEDALDAEEQDENPGLETWPANVSELLEMNAVEEKTVLGFYWDGFGPMSSCAGLTIVGNGSRRYLCFWDELGGYRALAQLTPWDDPLALQGTVCRLIRRNGKTFGTWLFGSLPTETTNYAPKLLSDQSVRQAYFDLLQHWQAGNGDAWGLLAEEHFSNIVEPNSMVRSLDLLERVAETGTSNWLEQLEDESEEMPDHTRQALFDEWFARSYAISWVPPRV